MIINQKNKWIFFVIIVVFIVVVAYVLGFRITYNPNIITDWTAVGAVGQWASVLTSVFVVFLSAYLTQKFNDKTKDIANSNRASVEIISEIEKRIDERVKIVVDKEKDAGVEKRVMSYIDVSIITETKRIAEYIDKTIEDTYNILKKLEIEDQIVMHIGDNSNLEKADILWKRK